MILIWKEVDRSRHHVLDSEAAMVLKSYFL